MTIRNKELHRLQLIIGVMLSIIVFVCAQAVSPWYYFGFILVVLVVTKTAGVQFDATNNRYRKYVHFCFMTGGTWKAIGENKVLVILVKHGVQTTQGTMMAGSLKTKGGFSELYLMDESHGRRFFIDASENHERLELRAKELSVLTGLNIEPYHPRVI